MVQASKKVDSAQSDSKQKYRQEVETRYYPVIVQCLQKNHPLLQVDQLKLPEAEQKKLEDLRKRLGFHAPQTWTSIEQQVCQALLFYVQEVRHVQNYHSIEIVRGILEHQQQELCISRAAANAIIKELIRDPVTPPPPNQHYQQKLKKYDEILATVIRKGLPIDVRAAWELHRLQQVLGLEDKDLPAADQLHQLQSARGIDYIPLWRKLKSKQWKDACEETCKRMVEIAGQREAHYVQTDAKLFPCTDLQTIDALWRHHSNGRFGFSVQQAIWQELKGDLQKFGQRVGWCRNQVWLSYEEMNFSLQAERGHLPVFPLMGWWCWAGGMKAMVEQFGSCTLTDSRSPHS